MLDKTTNTSACSPVLWSNFPFNMTILVTGGAGYIGCHTVVELLEGGADVVVVDNLSNSSRTSLERAEELTGKKIKEVAIFDLIEKNKLEDLFGRHKFESIIHFAGLKAVGESVRMPIRYYQNNLNSTLTLLEVMAAHNVKNFIFSSSATVYGLPQYLPLDEKHRLSCTNPYGRTKLFIEDILRDVHESDASWNIVLLRYFNPTGAHKSGRIGEDPAGIPNNLMPFIAQTAIGRHPHINVFGGDYDTPDGTGVRDYIHVVDLAQGHVKALDRIRAQCGCVVYNLGTGTGYSVLEMIKAFEKASGKSVPYKIVARRPGDVASCYADPKVSTEQLGWKASFGLEDMCSDLWRWQSMNPAGYSSQ